MTFRSVIVGLALGAAICGVSYFNDNIIQQDAHAALMGSYLPIAIFGLLMLMVLLVNPLLGVLRSSLAFSGKELAIVVMLACIAGAVPGGVLRFFNTQVMMPHHLSTAKPHWQKAGVFEQIPPEMLADPAKRDGQDPLDSYLHGMAKGGRHITLSEVPWYAWQRTLWFWMPLLLALCVALMGLSLVVHQQWSENERLRYPIAMFAAAVMPHEGAGGLRVFRNKAFWVAAVAVFGIHMTNYLHKWHSGVIEIPLYVDMRSIFGLSEAYMHGSPGDILMMPAVHFTVVGFTFFLASDVSLSLGLAPHLFVYATGLLFVFGIQVQGGVLAPSGGTFLFAGAWTGIALMLLYTGRRLYAGALARALFLKRTSGAKPYGVWGTRVFLVGAAMFLVMLLRVGLDWPLAILYSLGLVMIFVVLSRLVAETGVFLVHPYFAPDAVIFGFLGMAAIGPQSYLIMGLLSAVVLMWPMSALMPYVVQSLKIVELKGVSLGRSVTASAPALLIGFAIAVPVALYIQYDMGVLSAADDWTTKQMPRYAIDGAVHVQTKYEPAGGYPAGLPGGLARFSRMVPDGKLLICFGVAVGLVLLFSAARLRFRWWPFHPVMFAVLSTYQAQLLAFSFLLGWLIKRAVCGLGGAEAYMKAKPLMIGLIAGEIFAKTVPMIVGAIYFLATGNKPPAFQPWG